MSTTIGYGNLIDSATLSGTWTNTANLQNRYLAQKASASADAYLDIDLGSAQSIGLIALVSLSDVTGNITITAGTSAGDDTLYDSGSQSAYSLTDFALTFAPVTARYWRISTASGGDIGRVLIGPRFQPEVNIDWSPSLTVESRTQVIEALAGPEYFDQRPSRRVWQGHWSWLSEAEAISWIGIQQAMDVSAEVYLIYDDQDVTYRATRNFLGRLRTLGPIEYPYLDQYGVALEIAELI